MKSCKFYSLFSVLTYEGLIFSYVQKRTNKLEHVQHIKCKPSIPVIKDNTNKRSSYSQTLLRPYDTVKRTREILISNIHLLSPQKWSQFVHFNMGTLKSMCSSWFPLISRDKYEHTHLRVPIGKVFPRELCTLDMPRYFNYKPN